MAPTTAPAVRTTCAYCGVGCGMTVSPRGDGGFTVAGDSSHPANYGRLCAKGAALGETLGHDGRLLHPMVDGQRVQWDAALSLVAHKFSAAVAEHGPESVAFYVSGQLLTEDYYVANKLMKGFIGAANIDTNSRLCMASSVAGHKRAFGEDVVPGVYSDIEYADVVVLVGSNLAWCHPVLHQRLLAAREARGTRIVVIDPRATATSADADSHLALAAGSDVALFNGLLRHLAHSDALDQDYIDKHTDGFQAALNTAAGFNVQTVAAITGLTPEDIASFYTLFEREAKTVTVYSQGVNQSRAGSDKVNAIINCHLATARIGLPGCGPFSVTGQPNAMGGRETGGLANMLAAHLEIENVSHRQMLQNYWRSPTMAAAPGLKAVDLFRAAADGRIKALWIMATNPVVSMPDADAVRVALAACPFVVVSDIAAAVDTATYAHVLLPAAGWGEKDGTVTNSERRISRQRAFTAAPGEARPDWWALTEVARRMGFAEAFDYRGAADIYREYAGLTALAHDAGRLLNIGADADLDTAAYAAMTPRTWPFARTSSAPGGAQRGGERRLFGDGVFSTTNGRGQFVVTAFHGPEAVAGTSSPLLLNTGRMRDQWHTMTRSGRAAKLCHHSAEPQVEMHPRTARAYGLKTADLAVLRHLDSEVIVRVAVTPRQQAGDLFVPMHWSDENSAKARINALIPAVTDPISGQPELKAARVSLTRFPASWYAFGVFENFAKSPDLAYWARMRAVAGWRIELADERADVDFEQLFWNMFGTSKGQLGVLEYADPERGAYRIAAVRGRRLTAALFVSREPVSVLRNWACAQLGRDLTDAQQQTLLAGYPARGAESTGGHVVCTCHDVGSGAIQAAIFGGKRNLADVGHATAAGTNCGSCRGEIQRMIAASELRAAV